MKGIFNRKVFIKGIRKISGFIFFVLFLTFFPFSSFSARIKDIAMVEGSRVNHLVGFGIVVGLRGTGDTLSPQLTIQSLTNLLQRMGIRPDPTSLRSFGIIAPRSLKPRDSAIVMVTAELPQFAKPGLRIDVTVSSMGDARSIRGGQLVLTPLFGPDGKIWATAQGQIITGGVQVGDSPSMLKGGFATSGVIPGGGIVEKALDVNLNEKSEIRIFLYNSDFSTARMIQDAINEFAGVSLAYITDSRTINVVVPREFQGRVAEFISIVENLEVLPDAPARVVVNERTGTVVMGENVGVLEVAVSHGDIMVVVEKEPSPLETAPSTPQKEKRRVQVLPYATTVGDLTSALNKMGVSPQDMIAILQALKKVGALQAELITQ